MQPTSETVTRGTTQLMNLTYGYQAAVGQLGLKPDGNGTSAGNASQVVSITGTINGLSRAQGFGYDNLGRLASANGWNMWWRRYQYGRWGNRTSGTADNVPLAGGGTGSCNVQVITLQQSGSVPTNRISTITNTGSCDAVSTMSPTYDA